MDEGFYRSHSAYTLPAAHPLYGLRRSLACYPGSPSSTRVAVLRVIETGEVTP